MKRVRPCIRRAATGTLGFVAVSLTLHAYDRLPRPSRNGMPPSGLYDYGVMGPPAGHQGKLLFWQEAAVLKVQMPEEKPGDYGCVLKTTGLKLHEPR